ncbi:SPFH domain-containing protein [Streptomyces sp. NPDC000594]|uniref:SPFH domain-containing protein n=1 Tax=Streptomyces sp. NPDC000594 TaxID=3154261 RepID=UPI00331D34E0
MTTTTSEPEGGDTLPDAPPAPHGPPGAPRHTPVISQEATTEIPVHLLFRDHDSPPLALRPAVVARRRGTGEQPRIARDPLPVRTDRVPVPQRPGPAADPGLVERPAAALPGWTGMVAALCALAGVGTVLWGAGALPGMITRALGLPSYPYQGLGLGLWCLVALGVLSALFALGGIGRAQVAHAWVLTLFGEYRGSVRRPGLFWVNPLLLRRRVDVRLRHWRSEPMSAVDADGTALRVVVLVVWRVRDTARAVLGIEDHEDYLSEQVEAALSRVLSRLPVDPPDPGSAPPGLGGAPTLRDAEAVGGALTRTLAGECAAVGVEVFSAQPVTIEYAPEVAVAMRRRRIAAIDARHREAVLTSVVDAVDDTVTRLTARGLVELDDYERKALVKDLTVAFYSGRATLSED